MKERKTTYTRFFSSLLEPYRVDRDPAASIPIEDIEAGIRNADICLADITTDNPNVWFELGFAIATQKEVVLVASSERQRFPFDVQHRNVIAYLTESPRDFEELQERITKRLKAIQAKGIRLGTAAAVVSPVAPLEGLSAHEMVALVAVAENLDSPQSSVPTYSIRQDMERAGFTRIAATLGLAVLVKMALVTPHEESDYNGNPFVTYSITEKGFDWLMTNQGKLTLKESAATERVPGVVTEDDIPF